MDNFQILQNDTILDQEVTTKKNFWLGIFLSTSLISIWILGTTINFILAIQDMYEYSMYVSYIMSFGYLISLLILTPVWISILANRNKVFLREEIEVENIQYWGFWIRLWATLIDTVVSWFVIPIFFNLYFWMKDGQTIWYKICKLKLYRIKEEKIFLPDSVQLILYPFLKILSAIVFYIWFIMVGVTQKKQWLHNKLWKTVVIKVQK